MDNILREYLVGYSNLDENFRAQLDRIYPHYSQKKEIRQFLSKISSFKLTDDQRKKITAYLIYRQLTPLDVTTDNMMGLMYAYSTNHHDPPLILQSRITEKQEGRVALFNTTNRTPLVIKLYYNEYRRKSTSYENESYKLLGFPEPCVSINYRIWDCPVLVMEKLERIAKNDNPYEVARQVLSQLKKVHKIGVHCDIKPLNIMRKGEKYLLIDFGGFTYKKKADGYYRFTWSDKWTSQPRESTGCRVTYPKNDLLELAFTVRTLEMNRDGEVYSRTKDSYRTGFVGKLLNYVEFVKALPKFPSELDYDRAIDLFA